MADTAYAWVEQLLHHPAQPSPESCYPAVEELATGGSQLMLYALGLLAEMQY
jgi:hypothetical protein